MILYKNKVSFLIGFELYLNNIKTHFIEKNEYLMHQKRELFNPEFKNENILTKKTFKKSYHYYKTGLT